jgi:hypothetical protein
VFRSLKVTVPSGLVSTDQAARCTCTGRAWLAGTARATAMPMAAQAAPAAASTRRRRRLWARAKISLAGLVMRTPLTESRTSARRFARAVSVASSVM